MTRGPIGHTELPKHWVRVKIGDVAEVNPRKNVLLDDSQNVTFVPMAAVDEISGTIAMPIVRPYGDVRNGFTTFRNNDVLFAKITPSMENGKSAVARDLTNGVGVGSTEFHVLRCGSALRSDYLWRFVRQQSFRDSAQAVMSGAVGQQRVPADYLKKHSIPLAPLAEQARIVERIDLLLLRIESVRRDLENIPALISQYKSAVLAMAFTGALTRDWRVAGKRNAQPKGALPNGWTVRALRDISDIQGGIQIGKKRVAAAVLEEVPYLRVANVQRGYLKLDEIKTVAITGVEKERLLLRDGDILMNEGGDRDKLGRGWVWREQLPECVHQNHVFRIRLTDGDFPPEYVSHYANENGQQYFIDRGTQTTNLASISKSKVAAFPIPIPPTDEALEIVRRVNAAFCWFDVVGASHAAALRLLPLLDASIHRRAFRGELVPHDPTDEPASVSLDRAGKERDRLQNETPLKTPRAVTRSKDRPVMPNSLQNILVEATDWIESQDVFERWIADHGAETADIEQFYAELRVLDQAGTLESEGIMDDKGRKLGDRLRLKVA